MTEVNKYSISNKIAIEGQYDPLSEKFTSLGTIVSQQFRQNDNISHFICRLAYCRNEELRKWFLT